MPGMEQLHCILMLENKTEDDCEKCEYVEAEATAGVQSAWKHREGNWSPSDGSIGLGDTVAKVTKAAGIAWGVSVVAEMFNLDCGCEGRRKLLNKLFPYKK